MKVKVDQGKCIGCGLCYNSVAPQIFSVSEESGKSEVAKQPETPEEEQAAKDAIESCPVQAIQEDED